MVVINKLVCEDLGKGLEFSQPLFGRWQRREPCVHLGIGRHDVDREMVEGGEKRVHLGFVLCGSGGSSLSSPLTDPFLSLRQCAYDPDRNCR